MPTLDEETDIMSALALDLAEKTSALWRAELAKAYPNFATDDKQAGNLTAALGSAGMLCIVDAISRVEPKDAGVRLIAFDEIAEAAMGLLIAGATIAKIREFENARALNKDAPKTEVSG